MKRILVACFTLAVTHVASAQSSVLLPVAGAVAGQVLTRDKPVATQVAAATVGGLAVGFVGKVMADSKAKEDYRLIQLGRYQEAWIRSNTDWYYATMDRRSGLPPAFDGYWAMYSGLPDVEREFVKRRMAMPDQFVPTARDEYLNYLLLTANGSPAAASTAQQSNDVVVVPTTTAVMPARNVNGVKYRAQVREFPRLP